MLTEVEGKFCCFFKNQKSINALRAHMPVGL